jgi:hypothetical protein
VRSEIASINEITNNKKLSLIALFIFKHCFHYVFAVGFVLAFWQNVENGCANRNSTASSRIAAIPLRKARGRLGSFGQLQCVDRGEFALARIGLGSFCRIAVGCRDCGSLPGANQQGR